MKTKINILLEEFQLIINSLQKLVGVSHTAKDYAGYVKSLGGEVETFLKDAVYLNQSNNQSFYHLINNLAATGINAQAVADLHDLRVLYNDFKHDPLFQGDLMATLQILKKARMAIEEIKAASLGQVNAQATETTTRTVWIAAWDDYIGGMTEISVFLPNYDIDFPFGYDNFNIEISKWDEFKDHFKATGELRLGAEFVSEKAYQVWSANVDLIGVGAFTGDTRELNKYLSKLVNRDKESKLLDFLQRPNDSAAISVSLIYAVFDALRADNWVVIDDLFDEVRLRAAYEHAIPVGSQLFDHFINTINPLIINVDRQLFRDLKQILWLDEGGYAKRTKLITIIGAWRTAISTDGNLICCVAI